MSVIVPGSVRNTLKKLLNSDEKIVSPIANHSLLRHVVIEVICCPTLSLALAAINGLGPGLLAKPPDFLGCHEGVIIFHTPVDTLKSRIRGHVRSSSTEYLSSARTIS